MTEHDVDPLNQLIERLVVAIDQHRPKKLAETLWNVERIALWLGLSKITVEIRVVTRPDFPKALRPVDSKQAQRRWFASDVVDWARTNKGVLPTPRPGRRRQSAAER